MVSISTADTTFAAELAAFAARTFRDTFADQNDVADIDRYTEEAFSLSQTVAELSDGLSTFLLARRDDELLGYAKLRRGAAEPCVSCELTVELQRLYVSVPTIGSGVGKRLLLACIELADSEGFRMMWLGVWEHNPHAIEFYRRQGFETVGSHDFVVGSDRQTDYIMQRPIARLHNPELHDRSSTDPRALCAD